LRRFDGAEDQRVKRDRNNRAGENQALAFGRQ
jgi:hypothetical protein